MADVCADLGFILDKILFANIFLFVSAYLCN